MTDLDQEFETALERRRGARPGLGFAMGLINNFFGGPVTISSGPTLGSTTTGLSPPPRRHSARSELSYTSDGQSPSIVSRSVASPYTSYTGEPSAPCLMMTLR